MQFKKLVAAVSGAVLLMTGQLSLADSTNDLVEALVSKGVLTEEEGKLLTKGQGRSRIREEKTRQRLDKPHQCSRLCAKSRDSITRRG